MTARASRRRKKLIALQAQWAWQSELCFYCDVRTWIHDRPSQPPKAKLKTMATREHLIRVADDGPNTADNIVMACQGCNSSRGETPWQEYLEQKEALSRANCKNPEDGYGATIRPDGPTPEFRKQDTYFALDDRRRRGERAEDAS